MTKLSKERIAIVGAGAMGVSAGYHLSLANIGVDFLVRPARAAAMPERFQLYCYDDGGTPVFDAFGVLADPFALSSSDYSFVILALDGAALASLEGGALLAGIGEAILERSTVVIVGGVGIGLRELAIRMSGLPSERVICGRLAHLNHKVAGALWPLRPPTDPEKLAGADFAFRHINEGGFAIEDRN